jgi:hypothetical protein
LGQIIFPYADEVAENAVLQGTNFNKGDVLFKIKELKKKKIWGEK